MNIDHPFQFDARGQTARTTDADHVRDMIEQLLFTSAGERVNRPDFGSGLMQVVFAPNGSEIATAIQYTTQASLQRWLGDVIDLHEVAVSAEDATLRVLVRYGIKSTGQQRVETFERRSAG
jgi:uncharacterized protein